MRYFIVTLLLVIGLAAQAQIPTNTDKKYEYTEALTVKRASSKELQRRFVTWAKEYYKPGMATIEAEDTTFRWVNIKAKHAMPVSFFQVNRSHRDRELSYTLVFDTDKKNYTYSLSNIEYACVEVDRKGVEVSHSGPFENFKTPAKMSAEAEVHELLQSVISSFKVGAEVYAPAPEPVVAPAPTETLTDTLNQITPADENSGE